MTTTTTRTPSKTIYRVAPTELGWVIELAGDSFSEMAHGKAEAIARAKELARRAPIGGVVIVGLDGRIEQEIDVDPTVRPS